MTVSILQITFIECLLSDRNWAKYFCHRENRKLFLSMSWEMGGGKICVNTKITEQSGSCFKGINNEWLNREQS